MLQEVEKQGRGDAKGVRRGGGGGGSVDKVEEWWGDKTETGRCVAEQISFSAAAVTQEDESPEGELTQN